MPSLDDDPGFGKAIEDLSVQESIPKLGVEALAVPVLPRRARFNERCAGSDSRDPVAHRLGDELRAIVGADVSWHAAQDEEVRQDVDDVRGSQPTVDPDSLAAPIDWIRR